MLRRRWKVPSESRARGPSPSQVYYLLRSPVLRSEAAAAASLCVALGLIPERTSAKYFADHFYCAAMAERLCDAYEVLQRSVSRLHLRFEQLVMLAAALTRADSLRLVRCRHCSDSVLAERYDAASRLCRSCGINLRDAP